MVVSSSVLVVAAVAGIGLGSGRAGLRTVEGFQFPLAWPHKAEELKKSSKVEEIKEFLSNPGEWFSGGGGGSDTAEHKDDNKREAYDDEQSKHVGRRGGAEPSMQQMEKPRGGASSGQSPSKGTSDTESSWFDWFKHWGGGTGTGNTADNKERPQIPAKPQDNELPTRYRWWPWKPTQNDVPNVPPPTNKQKDSPPTNKQKDDSPGVQPRLPAPHVDKPKDPELPVPVPVIPAKPIRESVGTRTDKQEDQVDEPVGGGMGNEILPKVSALEGCIDMCEKKLASGIVTTMDGRTAQRKQNADAFVECSDGCVLQYQKKPQNLPPGNGGHWSPLGLGLAEFFRHTAALWKTLAVLAVIGLSVGVGVKVGAVDKCVEWTRENLPENIMERLGFGESGALMAEGSFCRTVADGFTFATDTCRERISGMWGGVTAGMGSDTNSEREGLVADEEGGGGPAGGGRLNWVGQAKAFAARGMYSAGQVAVYVLSASYLPDDVAMYIPWSDAAVRMGYQGAPRSEYSGGSDGYMRGDTGSAVGGGGGISTASTARGSVEFVGGSRVGDGRSVASGASSGRRLSGFNYERSASGNSRRESQNYERSRRGKGESWQQPGGEGSSDDSGHPLA